MKVAMVAHTDAPWTADFARALMRFGHTVRIFSFCPDEIDGLDVHFVGRLPYRPLHDKKPFVLHAPKLARLLRQFEPDVVLATYLISNGLAACLSWFGPLVVSAVGSDILRPKGTMQVPSLARKLIIGGITRRATLLHAVSDALADALVAYGVAPERIRTFPTGVDVRRFSLAPAPTAAVPHVVCTRRHAPVYDNAVIVEALAILKQRGVSFTATFLCGGVLLEERRAHIARLGLDDQVNCTGFSPDEQVPLEVARADVYVSASHSDGTSASLLEAMAVGPLPVLSDITANRPWVDQGRTGLLFPVGDEIALADALERALTDTELRTHARAHNRELVAARADQITCMEALDAMLHEAVAR